MPTAITIGKFSLLTILSLGVFSTFAEPMIVREATFEENELGDFPEGVFGGGWGTHADGKFFYVTNVHGCKSNRSLAIKILPSVGGMFGIGFPMKTASHSSRGVITVEMDVMREGTLNFYSEIRCADGKWNLWWVGDRLYMCDTGGYGAAHANPPGGFKPFKWYHIKYSFPLTPEDGDSPVISLTDVESGKVYEGVWSKQIIDPQPRLKDHGKWFIHPESPMNLVFNFYPHYFGSPGIFYFDNIKTTIDSTPIRVIPKK